MENIVRLRADETENAINRPTAALACCVDLPSLRGMDGEARLLPDGPPLSHHRQLERKPWAPRFSNGASPRSGLGSTSSARRQALHASTSARTRVASSSTSVSPAAAAWP